MLKLRDGVIAVFQNEEGLILLCERADLPGSWQFPQGGIDDGESAYEALFRELEEELGNNQCEIFKEAAETTTYLFPEKVKGNDGARQTWFLCRYKAGEGPDLKKSDCFKSCKWVSAEQALAEIISFKQASFRQGLSLLGLL